MLRTCLENPVFFPKMNLFYNQNTTLNNLLSFILKQFVEEVSRSHYIYRHRDSCGMLLRLQPHGKSKKLMIKAVSLKHDFHIFNGTVKCTIYYHRYFSLQTTDMSSFIIASICFFKIQSHSFHHQIFLQRFHTSLAVRENVKNKHSLNFQTFPDRVGMGLAWFW